MRRPLAFAVGIALIACSVAPSVAAPSPQSPDAQRALALLNTPCLVAQAGPATGAAPEASPLPPDAPVPTPSPSSSPTGPPLPIMPAGPSVLVPPPLPSTSPRITPPPLPTPTPSPASQSPAPIYIAPVTPSPVPTPTVAPTAGPIRASSPTPTPVPSPGETLGPNDYAVLGDTLTGNRNPGQPFDLDGHVNVIYADGTLVGEHAHYDGTHYIDVTGHPYLRNRNGDATLAADSIRFDTRTQTALLINGRGVTTEGVEQGKFHFNAREMTTERNGFTHGVRASFTTCENPHGGYHIESKTLDITPGERAVARHAVLFLGPLAILYLPILIIPLNHREQGPARRQSFVPLIGYSAAEGFYVKARIPFGSTQYYYGYYRVEYYTKIGYGLGYVATIARKDGKRVTNVDLFRLHNRTDNSNNWNVNLNDQEVFSPALRGTARFSYQADYGPLIALPANITFALGLTKTTRKDTENYSYSRQSTGGGISTDNYGLSDTYQFSQRLSNALTASFTTNANSYNGVSNVNTQLHFNTDTHLTGNTWDYDLTIDKYDSTTPSGVNKLPEFLARPHGLLVPHLQYVPITGTFTLGEYSDPVAHLATQRGEAQINVGPALAHTVVGDLNATLNVRQDVYGTGDAKAQILQQINLNSPIDDHFYNTLSYSNQHVNGLGNEPFSFDTIGGAYKSLQEVFKVYNKDVYALILQTGTSFNRMAQPIQYQLLARPSPRSSLILGGQWSPGAGNGFDRTGVQFVTPIGRGSDIQFSTFVDWKQKGRLESKQIFYRRVIGDCYEIRVSYNQDLKTVNLTLDILAFPSQGLNFGLGGQNQSIIPQSFASDQFFTGR